MPVFPVDLHDVLVTFYRWSIGLSVAIVLSTIWILLTSVVRYVEVFKRFFYFCRAIPILGLVPFVQRIFGVEEIGKVILIGWAASFPVWLAELRALEEINVDQLTMSALMGASPLQRFRLITFPNVVKGAITGFSIAIGLGWLVVVAAEMIGAYSKGPFSGGVGVKLFDYVAVADYKAALYCLLCFGLFGLVTGQIWSSSANRIARYLGVFLDDA